MRVYLVTAIGSAIMGGFAAIMMARAAVRRTFDPLMEELGVISDNAELITEKYDKYKYCNHD